MKTFDSYLRNIFESQVSGGSNKYEMKSFRARHDRVPPYPRLKKFKLLKIAVVISTGIYVGDVIGKSFQDTMLSIRDELWYPYDEWLKTKCQTRLLVKVNLLHFIRLQFLNGHILVPRKTREFLFQDDCVVTWCLLTKVVLDLSVTLWVWTSSTEQLYRRPMHITASCLLILLSWHSVTELLSLT